jgi:hypothetical protein
VPPIVGNLLGRAPARSEKSLRQAQEAKGIIADVVQVRDAIQSRADRLRHLLMGRTDRFVLAQVRRTRTLPPSSTELLVRYEPRPRGVDE